MGPPTWRMIVVGADREKRFSAASLLISFKYLCSRSQFPAALLGIGVPRVL